MPQDYLPRPDAEFVAWTAQFASRMDDELAALGLTDADKTSLTVAQSAFTAAFQANRAAQNAARSAKQDKDRTRDDLENIVRSLVRRIQTQPTVTDAQRVSLGLPVPDRKSTPPSAPTTFPVARVDTSKRLCHILHFHDSESGRRAKPAGVLGCEIWVKIGGAPPTDASELTFLALDTATPYTASFRGEDANQTAHYWLRWLSTRGQHGPWSETVAATITG